LQASIGNQALILQARGDQDGAIALYQEQERLCRELGNKLGIADSLINQADLLSRDRANFQLAKAKIREAIELWSNVGGMNMEITQAWGQLLPLQMGIGTGRVGRMIEVVVKVLIAAIIGAVGIKLGLWKPWLWIIGGPLAILSVFWVAILLTSRLQAALINRLRQWLAD
jgi:hypothetical protein